MPPAAPSELTVTELCALYWRFAKEHYQKHGKPTGQLPMVKVTLRLLKEAYGETAVEKFGPLAMKALQQTLICRGFARKYINDHTGRLKRVFKWAAQNELIDIGTWHRVQVAGGLQKGRTAARETVPIKPVADTVVDDTLPHLPAIVADMIRLQRLTGCRPQDVCNLRPCDVDRSNDVWIFRPSTHKTEHHEQGRTILIGPRGQDVLRPYLLRDVQAYCFSPVESERERKAAMRDRRKTRVQPSQIDRSKHRPIRTAGDQYTPSSYRRAIHRACAMNGIGRWSPNQLRHTAGTEIRAKYGLEAAQIVLGHAKADVTQIYAQRDLPRPSRSCGKSGNTNGAFIRPSARNTLVRGNCERMSAEQLEWPEAMT